jgi:hypothetical protein
MPTANDILVYSLLNSQRLLHRYIDDLSPQEFLHRPAPKANCTAWLIGHLTLSDRGALRFAGEKDLPPVPDGFEKQFSRDEGCPQAEDFGDISLLMPLFDRHRQQLIETVRRAPAELLDRPPEKSLPFAKTVAEFIEYMSLHCAMHAGQITIIRRSLGRPPVV